MSKTKTIKVNSKAMEPAVKVGATVTYDEVPFASLNVNDVIVFKEPYNQIVSLGRIVQIGPKGLAAKGDNNAGNYPYVVTPKMYVGKTTSIRNP